MHVTTNASAGAAAVWQDITSTALTVPPPGSASGPIIALAVDPLSSSTLYVGIGSSNTRHLFVTTDSGVSWNSIGSGLPDSPLNTIVVDPDLVGTLYVGTDVGAFWTSDAGAHWQVLGQDLPNVNVTSLVLQRSIRLMRAGTFGRGAWDLPLPALPPFTSTSSLVFGNVLQGSTSAAQTETLSNTLRTAQALGPIAVSGDYAMTTTCGNSLPLGGSCTVSITFTPLRPDARAGQLTFTIGGVAQHVSLAGTGTIAATLATSVAAVTVGQSITLTWSATSGSTCAGTGGQCGDNWNGPLAVNGSLAITESTAGSFNYVISCKSGTQTASAQASVTASVAASSGGGSASRSGGGGELDIRSLALLLGVLGFCRHGVVRPTTATSITGS
ncbi:MAG: hypothetical protein WDM77_07605 [Steroidobacteraceae bacterium]